MAGNYRLILVYGYYLPGCVWGELSLERVSQELCLLRGGGVKMFDRRVLRLRGRCARLRFPVRAVGIRQTLRSLAGPSICATTSYQLPAAPTERQQIATQFDGRSFKRSLVSRVTSPLSASPEAISLASELRHLFGDVMLVRRKPRLNP